jgi:hypothetical protein
MLKRTSAKGAATVALVFMNASVLPNDSASSFIRSGLYRVNARIGEFSARNEPPKNDYLGIKQESLLPQIFSVFARRAELAKVTVRFVGSCCLIDYTGRGRSANSPEVRMWEVTLVRIDPIPFGCKVLTGAEDTRCMSIK